VETVIKAMVIAVIGCGLLIAAFYVAYLFLALAALAVIGGIAYLVMRVIDGYSSNIFED